MADGAEWPLVVVPRAEHELKRLPAGDQARVRRALDGLRSMPPQGDILKLSGRDEQWRLRVGDYRILFARDWNSHSVIVLHVLPRGRAYRG